jgi:hypothetical protein
MRLLCSYSFLLLISWSGVSPLGMSATICPIVPAPDDEWWRAWSSLWSAWHGNRSTRRKPAPISPLLQIPHDVTWDRIWAAAGGSRRQTAWSIARPNLYSVTCSDESHYLHFDSAKSSYCRHTYSLMHRKFPRRRAVVTHVTSRELTTMLSTPDHIQTVQRHVRLQSTTSTPRATLNPASNIRGHGANINITVTMISLYVVKVRERWTMGGLYAFKCKRFHNTRHTATFGIPL